MLQIVRVLCALLSMQASFSFAEEMRVTKAGWTATDEQNYSEFVHAIGKSGCNNITSCLKNPANPYRKSDPANIRFFADCAKLPYILRGYFALKNGLPFSYVNDVKARGNSHDLRYSPGGNAVVSRRDMARNIDAIVKMSSEVNSAMFRVAPEFDADNAAFPDFYSAALNRDGIQPGTVIYDPAGHVAVVYEVTDDGRILYMDSHPDNSLTHGQYGEKFARSRPAQGAGFKNFRPLKIVGNAIVAAKNKELKDFSLDQYYGNVPSPGGAWNKGQFVFQNTPRGYYDFLRLSLAKGDLKYNLVMELETDMKALCGDLQDRVAAVDAALQAGIDKKNHPPQLPQNIYGTDGEWESFASPSRDARIKTSFRELKTQMEKLVEMYRRGDRLVVYEGHNLGADLRATYERVLSAPECQFKYTASDKTSRTLNYDQVVQRLFKLSFDPYDCAELRWGADLTSNEFATCRENRNELDWYESEQGLRNQINRTYDTPMGFTLEQLQHRVAGSGVETPPDIDLAGFLKTL